MPYGKLKSKPDERRRDLAKIHIAKKQLGMDETTYREMLNAVAGVGSAADLDERGRAKVIKHLQNIGFKPMPRPGKSLQRRKMKTTVSPAKDRAPLLSKIGAILADLKLPWEYANGMAKKMFKVDRVTWLRPEQLHKLTAALAYHQKRTLNKANQ